MSDVHAGHMPRERARSADNPSVLGVHVGRFCAFGLIGHTARHRLRSASAALARPLRPDVPSSRVRRG